MLKYFKVKDASEKSYQTISKDEGDGTALKKFVGNIRKKLGFTRKKSASNDDEKLDAICN